MYVLGMPGVHPSSPGILRRATLPAASLDKQPDPPAPCATDAYPGHRSACPRADPEGAYSRDDDEFELVGELGGFDLARAAAGTAAGGCSGCGAVS